jgi:hypothetical protein
MWRRTEVTTQAEFFQTHAVDGLIPDNLMADFLSLPPGDTALDLEGSSASPSAGQEVKEPTEGATDAAPAAAGTPAPAVASPTPAPADTTPVILAKDGVHTIPYERLEESRRLAKEAQERADAAAAQAAALAEENERLKAAASSPAPAPSTSTTATTPQPTEEGSLFGDYSDDAIKAGVEKLVAGRTAALEAQIAEMRQQLTPVQQAAQISANEEHWRTIYNAHPDMDSLVESAELSAWIKAQPTFVQAQYNKVLDEGTATDVVELFDAYKKATGISAPPAATPAAPAASAAAAAAARAAEAIANARQPAPTSLSEIPAGTAAHHDAVAAMLEMSPTNVLNKLENLTPQQIEQTLARIL